MNHSIINDAANAEALMSTLICECGEEIAILANYGPTQRKTKNTRQKNSELVFSSS